MNKMKTAINWLSIPKCGVPPGEWLFAEYVGRKEWGVEKGMPHYNKVLILDNEKGYWFDPSYCWYRGYGRTLRYYAALPEIPRLTK